MNAAHRSCPLAAALLAVLTSIPALAAPAPAEPQAASGEEQHAPRKAKQALDDRADPHMPLDNVGKGTHFARKPLGPGAYFDDANRAAVREYYAAHPARTCAGVVTQGADCLRPTRAGQPWQIGQPLPATALVQSVPKGIVHSLPKVPPGHSYLRVGGDILLVATGSRMVVDAIDGSPH